METPTVIERKSIIKTNKGPNHSDSKPKKFKALRILIVEPTGKYCRTVWCAIGLGLTHVMIGGTLMAMLMYSINKEDFHVGICIVAYHFFSAEAILSLNYANGWSSPLRLRHRRFAHVFLQLCALACAVTGTTLVTVNKGISFSPHGLTGILTSAFAITAFLSGPCALLEGRYFKIIHMSFGMPTFLLSSICLCFAIFTPTFKSWAGEPVAFLLLILVIFYTSFIIISCFLKCVMRV